MVSTEEEATPPVVSSARAKAEARRRRILDSASDRLGVVTGLPTALPATTTTTTPETATTTTEESTTEDASASTSEPTPAPKPSSSGSARLAAMRRRRFKKASEDAAKAESEGPTSAVATPEAAPTETTTTAPAEPPAEPTKPVETAPSTNTVEPSIVMSEGDSKEEPKKYLGVAKMRRRKLAEKKAAAQQQQQDSTSAATDADAAGTDTTGQVALVAPVPFVRPARFPIYMHLFTALLLFASGIGMGFHSATTTNNTNTSDVIVLWGMTPLQEGIGIVSRFSKSSSGGDDDATMRDLLQQKKDASLLTDQEEDDEFSSGKPKGVDAAAEGGERVHVNLDPIFQVDLDAVTSGPGLLMMLARWAVVMHRLFLSAVFYGPKRFLSNLLTLPMNLWASPPWVFVFSLVLRFLGKHVLRGGLPDLDATGNLIYTNTGGGGGGGENSKNLDLVDMAVRTAKEWIAKSFPNIVMIITIFMDARTDMYIVLCGLLVGLVLPLFSQQQQQSVPIANGLDEL
eukprot:scaffold3722_cov48-Attheya_sp.AAC.3